MIKVINSGFSFNNGINNRYHHQSIKYKYKLTKEEEEEANLIKKDKHQFDDNFFFYFEYLSTSL